MSKQRARGFTIIELMVSIAVIATILAFVFPSMRLMQTNSRMASAANDLATDLKQGRAAAVTNRTNFTVAAQVGGWSNGWQATFMASTDAAENSVQTQRMALQKIGLPPGTTIVQSVNPLIFNGVTGRVTDNAGNSVDVVLRICNSQISNETGFDVMLNRFGRILIQRHTNSTVCGS